MGIYQGHVQGDVWMDMEKEIANKIMLLGKWSNPKPGTGASVMYRAACDCTDPDCDITIDMEYDPDFGMIDLMFYKDVHTFDEVWDPETGADHIRNIIGRIKKALKLIFTGRLKMEESFHIQGEDQIDGWIEALRKGKEFILEDLRKMQEE